VVAVIFIAFEAALVPVATIIEPRWGMPEMPVSFRSSCHHHGAVHCGGGHLPISIILDCLQHFCSGSRLVNNNNKKVQPLFVSTITLPYSDLNGNGNRAKSEIEDR